MTAFHKEKEVWRGIETKNARHVSKIRFPDLRDLEARQMSFNFDIPEAPPKKLPVSVKPENRMTKKCG